MDYPPNHGWGVYRMEPWRIVGPFASKAEAEAVREAKGEGWWVRYGEFGVGIDGFTGRDEPHA